MKLNDTQKIDSYRSKIYGSMEKFDKGYCRFNSK